jgi:competence protein ComEC
MPFGDKSIDVVLATHTDADHIGGLPDVLANYDIGYVIENGGTSKTKIYQALEREVANRGIEKVIAKRGMRVMLDEEKNISFDILFPDRDVLNMESNDGSIVGKLSYGEHSFMLTGDATKYTELLVLRNETKETLHSTILKLGHHGSHTSSSESWLRAVTPEMAIISAGKNNRYGHPHQDVLNLLQSLSIPYRATYDEGTIIFETDGITLSKK